MYKFIKPITPGLRGLVKLNNYLFKGKPIKQLTKLIKKHAGRNNSGKITVKHRGGGHKNIYRIIDYKRNDFNFKGVVIRIEYDPNRNANIALIQSVNNYYYYIIAAENLNLGDTIESSNKLIDILPGNSMKLKYIPIGIKIYNVELYPGKGGCFSRSAGTSCQIYSKLDNIAILKLNSGERRKVSINCRATIGIVSNRKIFTSKLGKAGRKRWLGFRPKVRGVAMNPIDHPHGGGEGKTSGGRHPVSPWGKSAKGKHTRHNKRTLKLICFSRHKNK